VAEIPTLDEVRAYLKVPAAQLSDEDLERMRGAAMDDQTARCAWPEGAYPYALAQALLRRIRGPARRVGPDSCQHLPSPGPLMFLHQ
jgi:hypothetical protein